MGQKAQQIWDIKPVGSEHEDCLLLVAREEDFWLRVLGSP